MSLDDRIAKWIRELGFPIFVAGYLLLQMVSLAPKVEAMAKSLDQLVTTQTRLIYLLERR